MSAMRSSAAQSQQEASLLSGRTSVNALLATLSKRKAARANAHESEAPLGGGGGEELEAEGDADMEEEEENTLEQQQQHRSLSFLAPLDAKLNSLPLSHIVSRLDEVVTLTSLQAAILGSTPVQASPRAYAPSRVLLRLPSFSFPTSIPVCPTEKQTSELFTSSSRSSSSSSSSLSLTSQFTICVYNAHGYSFFDEFKNVYRGKPTAASSLTDFIQITIRALITLDPGLQQNTAQLYARYISRMVVWEMQVAAVACGELLALHFPQLKATVRPANFAPAVKIYLTRDAFYLRTCPRLVSMAKFGRSAAERQAKDLEAKAAEALHFNYYRHFALSLPLVQDFFANDASASSSSSSSKIPLPPPKPPSRRDLSMYITCSQNLAPNSTIDVLHPFGDEDDDLDQNPNAPQTPRHQTATTKSPHAKTITTTTTTALTPSPCAELFGWGHNSFSSLGIEEEGDEDTYHLPRPTPIPSSLSLERVRFVACSPRHTLVLTYLGTVYSCGENTEGALGLGDMRSRSKLTPVVFPTSATAAAAAAADGDLQQVPMAPRIAKISAGSGSIGSHSMAIDAEGFLYGWGVSFAVGHGGTKPVLSPLLISTFTDFAQGEAAPAAAAVGVDEREEDDEENWTRRNTVLGALKVKDVSCGGGFTVCVLTTGRVCSWGMWSHGRLGLGVTPTIRSSKRYGGGTKLARYQLRPAYVRGIAGAESVSCGEAHVLCVLQNGQLYSWGQNSCGQLGVGPSPTGFLRDALRPMLVCPFDGGKFAASSAAASSSTFPSSASVSSKASASTSATKSTVFPPTSSVVAATCCAGAYHSVVVDAQGRVWTWGARGSTCLGHNDAFLEGAWGDRVNTVFAIVTNSLELMVPFELLAWCQKWSKPRVIVSMLDLPVTQVSAGDMHTAMITNSGHLFICGAGPVVPPLASASLHAEHRRQRRRRRRHYQRKQGEIGGDGGEEGEEDDDDGDDDDEDDDEEEDDEDDASSAALRVAEKAHVVSSPRRPSASWLDGLSSKRAVLVAGSGARCFVLQDEENIAISMTAPLLRKTILGYGSSAHGNDTADDASLDSHMRSDDEASVGSYFEQRGRSDCMLLASGKVLLCHRALLAMRSPELRDMIASEMPSDSYASSSNFSGYTQPTQLLLPELHLEAARALLSFLYTDVLPRNCFGNVSLLRSLERASISLRLPRLQILTQNLLKLLAAAELAKEVDDDDDDEDDEDNIPFSFDMPPPTLARDLGALVGDPEFADVRFVAEGRALVAHRFILESRCEYFRVMFRSGMSEGAGGGGEGMVDVVVPDTFVGFLRLLIFIYTDTLPDGSDTALMEDLLSADRYNVPDMKVLCESMLVPSAANWLTLLSISDMLNSANLRHQVECFLRDNFSLIGRDATYRVDEETSRPVMDILKEHHPALVERVFELRREAYPLPPSQLLIAQTNVNVKAEAKKIDLPFPIWALVASIVAFYILTQIGNVIVLGPIMPFINGLFMLGMILWSVKGIAWKS